MTACTLFTALLFAAPAPKEKPKEAPPTGTWSVYWTERMGQITRSDLEIAFAGPTLVVAVENVGILQSSRVEFDVTAKVKEITIFPPGGPSLGIYKFEGDRLLICLGKKERPTSFAADGPDQILFVLKRAKK